MEYLVIQQLCGEEDLNKFYLKCDSDDKIYTKLCLISCYGYDEDEEEEYFEEYMEELNDDIRDKLDIDEVSDEVREKYCKDKIWKSEDTTLLILNLDTKEEILDYM